MGKTGAFGLDRENDNSKKIVEFCAERAEFFQHKGRHKYK